MRLQGLSVITSTVFFNFTLLPRAYIPTVGSWKRENPNRPKRKKAINYLMRQCEIGQVTSVNMHGQKLPNVKNPVRRNSLHSAHTSTIRREAHFRQFRFFLRCYLEREMDVVRRFHGNVQNCWQNCMEEDIELNNKRRTKHAKKKKMNYLFLPSSSFLPFLC